MPSSSRSRQPESDIHLRESSTAPGLRLALWRKALYGIGAVDDSAGTIHHRLPPAANRTPP